MDQAVFSIKNYRCFGHEPQKITFGDGFTGIVGPNNAGKTAILKFVYELRHLWEQISQPNELCKLIQGNDPIALRFLGVLDQEEVYNHHTNAPISFKIDFSPNTVLSFDIPKVGGQYLFRCVKATIDGENIKGIGSHHSDTGTFIRGNLPSGKSIDFRVDDYANFFDILAKAVYIPAFRNIINIGQLEKYYDIPIGVTFISEWRQWKTGSSRRENQTIQDITNDIKELLDFKNLEINASQDGSTLKLIIDGKAYALGEVGSGIAQFILTFASVALKRPSLLLIDEPELNLHPSLQLKFLTSLASYTKHGVMFATHSVGLARSAAERIYSVVKKDNSVVIKDLEATDNYVEFLGELSFSSYQEIGASKILLVEGPTEVKTFQQFLRKVGKDTEIVVFNLGGASMIESDREIELAEILRLGDPAKVKIISWIDSEKEHEGDFLKNGRQSFINTCKKLDITITSSERRAMENYFSQKAIHKALQKPSISALSPFEKLDGLRHWPKRQNWRIAREMDIKELDGTDLGIFIKSL